MGMIACDKHGLSGIVLVEKRIYQIVNHSFEKIIESSIRDVSFYDDGFCFGGGMIFLSTALEQKLDQDDDGFIAEYNANEFPPVCIKCFKERLI